MTEERFLRAKEVAERMDISLRTVWRMVKSGKLPQPIRYNRKLVLFRLSDLKKAEQEALDKGKQP
jgi:excisionase family DNA binding protein